MARKKNSKFAAIFIGPILIIGGMMALWENEGRFNYYEAARDTVPVFDTTLHAGETISYTSDLDTSIPIPGLYVEEFTSYLKVHRRAEIYSWEEDTDSDGNTTWSKGWYSHLEHNHRNNGLVQKLRSGDLYPEKYVVGDMTISPRKIHFVDDDVDVSLNNLALSSKGREIGLVRSGSYFYLSKGRSDNLGDERISYDGIPVSNVASYFGLIEDGKGVGKQFDITTSWISGIIGNDGILHHLVKGNREVALDKIESDFNKVVWFTRLGGTVAIIFGLNIFFSVFVGLLYRIPLLGDLVELGVFLLSLVLGLSISLVVIITSLVIHNAFTIALPLIVILAGLYYLNRRSKNTTENAKKILSEHSKRLTPENNINEMELTFKHLTSIALADGGLDKKENKILVDWGKGQDISKARMKEIYDEVKSGEVKSEPASRKDLELMILIALSDGDISNKEMHLLSKLSFKMGLTTSELKAIIGSVEEGTLAV